MTCDCACCANALDPGETNARPTMAITGWNNLQLGDFIIFYFEQLPEKGESNIAD
jgi:hypothetical protein